MIFAECRHSQDRFREMEPLHWSPSWIRAGQFAAPSVAVEIPSPSPALDHSSPPSNITAAPVVHLLST